MKKSLLLLLTIMFFGLFTYAQGPIGKGEKQLNAGVGFSGWGIPLYIGGDYGVHEDITVGLELSYRSYNENLASTNYHSSILGFAGNGNYHFNRLLEIPKNFDFYAGLNIGFYVWNSSADYPGTGTSGLGLGAQVGGRYYLNDKLSLNLEFGGGNATTGGKFGVTFKF